MTFIAYVLGTWSRFLEQEVRAAGHSGALTRSAQQQSLPLVITVLPFALGQLPVSQRLSFQRGWADMWLRTGQPAAPLAGHSSGFRKEHENQAWDFCRKNWARKQLEIRSREAKSCWGPYCHQEGRTYLRMEPPKRNKNWEVKRERETLSLFSLPSFYEHLDPAMTEGKNPGLFCYVSVNSLFA